MTDVSVTAANISADQTHGSVIRNYRAASQVTVGDVVYLDGNGRMARADADLSEAASRGVGIVVSGESMYGETTIEAGQFGSVCVFGPVFGFSGLTPGANYWVSKTPGKLDDTQPTSPTYRYIMGYAVSSDTFFVMPGKANTVSA